MKMTIDFVYDFEWLQPQFFIICKQCRGKYSSQSFHVVFNRDLKPTYLRFDSPSWFIDE